MLGALARGLFGTANDRVVKGFDKPVAKINALEPELAKLSDEQLRARTTEFRERLAKGGCYQRRAVIGIKQPCVIGTAADRN